MALGGPDTTKWVWEEALNIFTLDPTFPIVPQRSTVLGVPWLTWRVYTHLRGPSNKVPTNMIHAEGMTFFTSWYAVADASTELEGAAATYFANGNKVVDSLKEDVNDVARHSTFELAATTLGGMANWLTAQVTPLETWRNKTGHRGDDFQGTGAGAFWNVLDELANKCDDLVAQMTKDRTSWEALRLVGGLLKRTGEVLDEGRARWQGGEVFTYDTGLGFSVTAPGSELSTPQGVVRAIWQAPELVEDFGSHFPPKYTREKDGWPTSTYLGGTLDESNGAPREKLEEAAQHVWKEHLKVVDAHGASVAWFLDLAYRQTLPYLPSIRTPVHLNLSGGTGGPDEGGAGPGGDGPGPGGGDGSTEDKGPVTTTTSSGPPPPPFTQVGGPGAKFPPPITQVGGGNTFLKVPTGSYVGRDGVVIGPDGKPVLGPDGRPIIVPPGSRVNGNGEIVGPRGTGNLEQKDRLRKAYPPPGTTVSSNAGDSSMERYLKSLRRTPPPLPPLRAPDTMPMTMSKFDPQANFHSGPGSLGGGRIGVSSDVSSLAPSQGGKPASTSATGPPTLGGPKGAAGTGSGSGVPFYPPSAGGAGGAGQGKGERDRDTWIAEDEKTWGTDPTVAPGVLGRRRRRTRSPGSTQLSSNPQRDYTLGLGDGNSATGQGTGNTTG